MPDVGPLAIWLLGARFWLCQHFSNVNNVGPTQGSSHFHVNHLAGYIFPLVYQLVLVFILCISSFYPIHIVHSIFHLSRLLSFHQEASFG